MWLLTDAMVRPSPGSAREAAKWLAKAGKGVESARHYADAFVAQLIETPRRRARALAETLRA